MMLCYNEHQVERESGTGTGEIHRHGTIIIYDKFGSLLHFLRVNLDCNWGRQQKSQVCIKTIDTWNNIYRTSGVNKHFDILKTPLVIHSD